jgi:glycine oxidase
VASIGPRSKGYDVAVVGAGLIGLACAWRAAQRGLSVVVIERGRADELPAGASGVAAGMLAPVTEAEFGEEGLLRLNLASRELWPGFAAELEERTGRSCGYRESGALVVAADRDDVEELRRLHGFQRSLGLDAEWLPPRECRRLEPALSPRVGGGILAPQDGHVDPRAVAGALRAALEAVGAELRCGVEAQAIEAEGGRVTGLRTSPGSFAARAVVVAAGPWSAALAPEGAGPPVRPVKGQLLELRVRRGFPDPVNRIVRTPRCYLLSRGDGRVVLGATVEERGFDTAVTADGVYRLLEAAWEVVPEVAELELVRARAGLRPGSPDNAPLIGAGEPDGIVWATGHYRNGVLLTPITARAVAGLLAGDEPSPAVAGFGPERFAALEGVR